MFVISEIGINHNGSLDIAKKLIKVAADCGCDAVKFQKREIEIVYTSEYLKSHRESPWGDTQMDQKQGLEFTINDFEYLKDYSNELGIVLFTSAWDHVSQSLISKLDLKYNKIASAMTVCEPFLKQVAAEGKHTFISTGMCEIVDIENAVNIFRNYNCPFELMHTVSTYPMSTEEANLVLIPWLREYFKCDVGYSGHESGIAISTAAAALGISSLERHITLDRAMYGSDQSSSLEPTGLRQLVGAVRKVEKAMGSPKKFISDAEKEVAIKLRAHLNQVIDVTT